MKAIINAKVITEQGILKEHALLFTDKITAIVPLEKLNDYPVKEYIDAKNNFLSAGFIDIHIHGSSGADTMDEGEEALRVMRTKLPATGVTSFLPTTMTMDFFKVTRALQAIRKASKEQGGANILGANVEGPFINPKNKGAHNEEYIGAFDAKKIAPYLDIIKLITIAPELPGSQAFIKMCVEENIVVAMGHSSATYEEAMEAISFGAKHVTHTFNAMSPLNHRQPGLIGAALDSDITCELIADNIHVHQTLQRMLLKTKGLDGVILITDAMRASLLAEGEYELGGQSVFVKSGEARLSNGVIAGSVLTLSKAVYNFMKNTGLAIEDAVKLVTVNPARLLSLNNKGSIQVGYAADLTIFDEDVNVLATFVGGNLVYGGGKTQFY